VYLLLLPFSYEPPLQLQRPHILPVLKPQKFTTNSSQILLTPLYMLSFLLSLLYISRLDSLRRTAPQRTSFLHPPAQWGTSFFSSSTAPEPYQCPKRATWGTANTKLREADRELVDSEKRGKRWVLHKKIRKMARLEIGDAIEMRGRVMLVLAIIACLTCAGVVLGLRWVWGWFWGVAFKWVWVGK
jgi:hypothetical protein